MKFFDPKKKDSAGPVETPSHAPAPSQSSSPAPSHNPVPESRPTVAPSTSMNVSARTTQSTLGAGIIVRGDIKSEENVTIDGILEGSIVSTRDVFIGTEGKVKADITASNVIIAGKVVGNVTAMNKVDLTSSGQLQGNIRAPKLAIAESALFKGSIDMSSPESSKSRTGQREETGATTSPAL